MADKKEKAKAELKYQKEARYLAMSYTKLLEERDRLQKRIDGDWTYTKEMAIAELSSITASFDSERVQTSNIGNPTERIAIKLTDEFMKRRQAEMYAERDACIRKREYIDWKIEVVETVWKERSNKTQKVIFQLLFYQHKTFCETMKPLIEREGIKESVPLLIGSDTLIHYNARIDMKKRVICLTILKPKRKKKAA